MVVEALAARERLDEHLPRLDGPEGRHEVDASEEEALRLDDSAATQQDAHPLLRGEEEGVGLPVLRGLAKVDRRRGRRLLVWSCDGT